MSDIAVVAVVRSFVFTAVLFTGTRPMTGALQMKDAGHENQSTKT
jgi:hypothetical protein